MSAQRLPTPGGDDGNWGEILNDFLEVSHNPDGTLTSSSITSAGAELTTNKNQPSGYAGLNSSGFVPLALLPANIPLSDLAVTGTASSSTYLRGDGTWSTPAGGVTLDSTSSDIQPDTTSGTAVAGSTNKAADAGHQHTLVTHDHSTTNKGGLITPTTGLATTGTATSSTFLRGDNTWIAPPSASNATNSAPGLVQLSGDLAGTATSPVVAKLNGGIVLPASPPSATGQVLTTTGTGGSATTSWSTPGAGVTLDSTSSDIQPLGAQAAGTNSQAARADHVHPTTGLITTSTGASGDLAGTYPGPTLSGTPNVLAIIESVGLQNITWTAALPAGGNKITGLGSGSNNGDSIALGQSGTQLAIQIFSPSATTNYTRTSAASWAAIDTTNLSISFVAPPSGSVFIEVDLPFIGFLGAAAINNDLYICFVTHNTTTQVSEATYAYVMPLTGTGTNTYGSPLHRYLKITGLTSGTSYHLDLAWQASLASGVMVLIGNSVTSGVGGGSYILRAVAI